MADTNILTEDEIERALKDYNDGADLAACHIPALCQTVRALRAETNQLKEELEVACEFCDEPSYDKAGNALTFLVCGRCWNKNMEVNRQTISTLRDELAALTRERDALRKQQGKTNDS